MNGVLSQFRARDPSLLNHVDEEIWGFRGYPLENSSVLAHLLAYCLWVILQFFLIFLYFSLFLVLFFFLLEILGGGDVPLNYRGTLTPASAAFVSHGG